MTSTQTRRFVIVFVALMLGLSVLATVLITRGWGDDELQEQVGEIERDRREAMPRLDDG
ncbi:hypothetical protein RQM47_06925 [Rubrivirga sp. S365]|uniref:Two-component sensor histidine kinase n=1 Tax=Rubrivirga litoralis TaxID=3075598 RepID=A0ABU3BSI0_9BACT|nr:MULTISPECIES: hypothetical protein [unclassified Rubrivirga]MDT0632242.1 hypothetical protein [Rubrivirga sp. F394]MDT7856368.1 hypothetical protein [Rubrivirga sp. S365]